MKATMLTWKFHSSIHVYVCIPQFFVCQAYTWYMVIHAGKNTHIHNINLINNLLFCRSDKCAGSYHYQYSQTNIAQFHLSQELLCLPLSLAPQSPALRNHWFTFQVWTFALSLMPNKWSNTTNRVLIIFLVTVAKSFTSSTLRYILAYSLK